ERWERERGEEQESGRGGERGEVARFARGPAGGAAARGAAPGALAPGAGGLHLDGWRAQPCFSCASNFDQSCWMAVIASVGDVLPAITSWKFFASVLYMDGEAQSVYSVSPPSCTSSFP